MQVKSSFGATTSQTNSSQAKAAFTKIALAVTLATSDQIPAATINVNAGCTLRHAILAANSDAASGGCPAGSGADTINLQSNTITFTAPDPGANPLGDTALPLIDSEITLQGTNSVLLRSSAAATPDFRLLAVTQNGALTINDVGIFNGRAISGGAIVCNQGTLTLYDTRIWDSSSSQEGGGIAADNCSVTVSGSSSLGNNSSGYGGALHTRNSTVSLSNSRISGNEASRGGGVAVDASNLQMNGMEIESNEGFVGGALYMLDTSSGTIIDSEFVGNEAGQSGGALAMNQSSVTINQGYLSGNRADDGGAIWLENNSELNLTSSQLSENSVGVFGSGGAIYSLLSTATVGGSSITANSASFGGGIFALDSTLSASNSLLSNNTADRGGAFSVNDSNVSLSGNQITSNSAILTAAGLLLNNNEIPARLTNNLFSNNNTGGYGGGMAVIGSTDVITSQDRFTNNTANRAGGININGTSNVILRETSVQDNSATTAGGILIDNSELTVERSTISTNEASTAAGISAENNSDIQIQNSTVSLNTANFAIGGINLSNSNLSLNHATVFQNSGGAYASGVYRGGPSSSVFLVNSIVASNGVSDCNTIADTVFQGNWLGDSSCAGDADGDPQLGPLANNGGPTQTHALAADSGAIDIAINGFCENPVGRIDQRGFQRVGACDSGAFEFRADADDTTLFVIPLADGRTVVVPL